MTKLQIKSVNTFTDHQGISTLLMCLQAPVCLVDASQQIVLANDGFQSMMIRFQLQQPSVGMNMTELLCIDPDVFSEYLTQGHGIIPLHILSPLERPELHISSLQFSDETYYLLELKLTMDFQFSSNKGAELLAIIPIMPDCAMISRLSDGKILEANDFFYQMFGYDYGDFLGKTTVEIGMWANSDQRNAWVRELCEKKVLGVFETLLYTKEKKPIVVVISARIVDVNGELCVLSVSRDVTKQKENEIKIQKQEAELRTLINTIPDLVWMKDKDGLYLNCNYRFLQFVGKEKAELIGKSDYDLFDKELADFFRLNDYNAIQSKTFCRNEEWVTYVSDGHSEYLETIKTPVYSQDNELHGVLGIGRDITERHKSDLKLQKSEILFKTVFETNPDVMTLTRLHDGIYRNVNSGFCRVLKYAQAEVINHSSLEKNIWVDDQERRSLIEDLQRYGVVYNKEYRFLSKDNELIYGLMSARVIEIEGEAHLLAITRPINDLKAVQKALQESEANLKMLFDSMAEVVILHELICDETGKAIDYKILNCNDSFTKVSGVPAESVVGRLGSEIFKTTYPPYLDVYSQVVESGNTAIFQTNSVPEHKHLLVSVVKMKSMQFATISTDVTDLKRAENELIDKNKELEKYLYAASHDLRSPMVNIQGFSQRMVRQIEELSQLLGTDPGQQVRITELLTTEMPKTLGFILGGVSKMDNLINSLLTISRTGRQSLVIQNVDMNELFRKIVQTFAFEIAEYQAEIIIDDLAPCCGDELQLNQLFSNLMANALKYRDKSRVLCIRVQSEVDSKRVVYRLSDNGIGISEKNLTKIWDVFFRVNPVSDTKGDGIGLSLVKTIVGKHRGQAWVESTPGEGSTFGIELFREPCSESDESFS